MQVREIYNKHTVYMYSATTSIDILRLHNDSSFPAHCVRHLRLITSDE